MIPELESDMLARIDRGERVMMEDFDDFKKARLPELQRAIAGRWSFTDLVSTPRVRYVDAHDWPWRTLDLVRPFLGMRYKEANRKAAMHSSTERRWLDLPAPNYYEGGTIQGDYAYVDIRSTFYSIYRLLNFYDPAVSVRGNSVSILKGWITLDECEIFARDKVARNAVVGLARTQRWIEYHYGKPEEMTGVSRITSPGLWAVVALVLNAIALDAIEKFGAVYVYTDGYIVPADQRQGLLDYLCTWALSGRVEAFGEATIRGRGSYDFGKKQGRSQATGVPHREIHEMSPRLRTSLRNEWKRVTGGLAQK